MAKSDATTHELKMSRKWGSEVPSCQMFSLHRPRMFKGTKDQKKVDCKRCAKIGGYEPAAKPEPVNPTGTCQCCFGDFKALPKKGEYRIALHGYQRPGYGYIIGRCMGENHLPFEGSCEQTKKFKKMLEDSRDDLKAYRGKLQRNEVESLSHTKRVRDPESRTGFADKTFTVLRGAAQVGEYNWQDEYIPDFETLRERAIKTVNFNIEQHESHIEELGRRIKEWKPVEFPRKK